MKVYFDNAHITADAAEITLRLSFSAIEIFLPKGWRIVDNIQRSFSGIEEKNRNAPEKDAPVVTINGEVSFSGVTILYV
jgi:hypothetical protein